MGNMLVCELDDLHKTLAARLQEDISAMQRNLVPRCMNLMAMPVSVRQPLLVSEFVKEHTTETSTVKSTNSGVAQISTNCFNNLPDHGHSVPDCPSNASVDIVANNTVLSSMKASATSLRALISRRSSKETC